MPEPIESSTLLFAEAIKLDLDPIWETDYGLFSVCLSRTIARKSNLSKPTQPRQYFFHCNLNLNGERSRILVKNKHFTRLILDKHGMRNIPYLLPESFAQLKQFFFEHRALICKPLLGQRSRGIYLIKDLSKLAKCSLKMTFFEKYVEGYESRYLLLDQKVIAVQKKVLVPTADEPWKLHYTGLEPEKWRPDLMIEAKKVGQIFGLRWLAVDFIIDKDNQAWLLEVNSAPGIVKIHLPDAGIATNAANLLWQTIITDYQRDQEKAAGYKTDIERNQENS
ncbi:MAG TPA: hypothetical protein PLM16_00285 [Candidatus Woesebacteria bacterium]|nr:hypothetical protein [Candidatus Woesebacteria bacterium]